MPTQRELIGVGYRPPAQGRVSAVIVTFHTGWDLLEVCIKTCLEQCAEVIVIDNGNPMADRAKLDAQSGITLIRPNGNVGFGRACNLGAARATGTHLLFLNPDAAPRYRCVQHLLDFAADDPGLAVFGAKVTDSAGHEQRGSRRRTLTPVTFFTGINQHETPMIHNRFSVDAVSGSAMFMTRQTFETLGGFDERYFLHVEDLDICKRTHDLGGHVYHVPDAEVTHIGATSDVPNWIVETHKRMGFKTYMLTHYPRAGRLLWPAMSLALRLRSRRS